MAMTLIQHFITAAAVIVVLEVTVNANHYEDAECVPSTAIGTYSYYGNKSIDRVNRTCHVWKDVMKYHLKLLRGYNQFFFADERLEHNHCRSVRLNTFHRDRRFNNASAHNYVHEDGWQHGPWCYVKLSPREPRTRLWGKFNSDFIPSPCFESCGIKDENITTTTVPSPKKSRFFKYADFIEHLTDSLFTEFDHGPNDYYDAKPSDELLSESFKRNCRIICYVGMPLMLVVIGCVFLWHYWQTHKASKAINLKLMLLKAVKSQVSTKGTAATSPTPTCPSPASIPSPKTDDKSHDKKVAKKIGKRIIQKKPKASKLRKK